jgi:hypothetical protein
MRLPGHPTSGSGDLRRTRPVARLLSQLTDPPRQATHHSRASALRPLVSCPGNTSTSGNRSISSCGVARRLNIGGDMRPPRALQDERLRSLCVTTYFRDRTLACISRRLSAASSDTSAPAVRRLADSVGPSRTDAQDEPPQPWPRPALSGVEGSQALQPPPSPPLRTSTEFNLSRAEGLSTGDDSR